MGNKIVYIIFWIMLFANVKASEGLVKIIDQSYDNPHNSKLLDLYLEIDSPQITKWFNAQKSFGSSTKIYFKVFWATPGKWDIQVKGFTGEFKELRASLKNRIRPVLEWVIPTNLETLLRPYKVENIKTLNGYSLKATNANYATSAHEINLSIDSKNRIYEGVIKRPIGTEYLSYQVEKFPKGWRAVGISSKLIDGLQTTVTKSKTTYENISKVRLPTLLTVSVTQSLQKEDEKTQADVSERTEEYKFYNYAVNKTIARDHFGVSR